MSSHLTYRPRDGVVFGTVAGQAIRLATLRNQAGLGTWHQAARSSGPVAPDVTDWPKVQELRTGGVPAGTLGHRLTVAENAALEIYDYPGAYAPAFRWRWSGWRESACRPLADDRDRGGAPLCVSSR